MLDSESAKVSAQVNGGALLKRLASQGTEVVWVFRMEAGFRLSDSPEMSAADETIIGIAGVIDAGVAAVFSGAGGFVAGVGAETLAELTSGVAKEHQNRKFAEDVADRLDAEIGEASRCLGLLDLGGSDGKVRLLEEESFRWGSDGFSFGDGRSWSRRAAIFFVHRILDDEVSMLAIALDGSGEGDCGWINLRRSFSGDGASDLKARWELERLRAVAKEESAKRPPRHL